MLRNHHLIQNTTMRNIIAVALMTLAFAVEADWEKLTSDEKMAIYIDRASIRDKANERRVWLLADYKKPPKIGSIPFMSARMLEEFECSEERFRTLSLTGFSAAMGNGKAVYRDDHPTHWHYAAPGVAMGVIMTNVCPPVPKSNRQ